MYEDFYRLNMDPFPLSPTGNAAYEHSSYSKARAYIEYALYRGEGIVLITGQPGCGKTMLVKELMRTSHDMDAVVLALTCQTFSARELVSQFARTLGVNVVSEELSTALMKIQEALKLHRHNGHRAVLVLDEAQSLSTGALEQARLLSNYQAGDQPLLQIVLVGQPELRHKILSPELLQLHQRIVSAIEMQPLDTDQTRGYFLHRMTSAGWSGEPVINEDIFELLQRASTGIPRWINQIGSRLLLHGMLEEKRVLGVGDVQKVINDMSSESLLPTSARASKLHAINSSNVASFDSDH